MRLYWDWRFVYICFRCFRQLAVKIELTKAKRLYNYFEKKVIENQITPLTFSNFDIAGIDSTREYLIYRIIKSLEKDQGQLEHVNKPGVSVQTFTQQDLNAGLILYYSPKEIGISPREFLFTFIGKLSIMSHF